MDKRSELPLARRICLVREVATMFIISDNLTKKDIVAKCSVALNDNTFNQLTHSGVLVCNRGRKATYNLGENIARILAKAEYYASKMTDIPSKQCCVVRKREAKCNDYRKEIKKLKAHIEYLENILTTNNINY